MNRGIRRLASVLIALLVALALSGCVKLDMGLELSSDNTVDGSVIFAVKRSLADLAGGEDAIRQSLTSGDSGFLTDQPESGSVETRDYSDDDWVGVEYLLSDIPLSEFSGSETGQGEDLSITRDGDQFVVSGTLDLTQGTETDQLPGTTSSDLLQDAEIKISVTFPGKVIRSNGTVDGNTVTWTPGADHAIDLSAVGEAEDGSSWWLPVAIAGALVVVLVVILVVVLISRGRRHTAPSAAATETSFDPPEAPPPSPGT